MNTPNDTNTLPAGTVVQYRRVGTFTVVSRTAGTLDLIPEFGPRRAGRYDLAPLKCAKSYRDKAAANGGVVTNFWVSNADVVAP